MIINLFLVVFLLFMVYWWSVQGLFSGVMHLVSVIVAGSLAFAMWEPITNGIFMRASSIAPYAWGLGLIVPFVILLTVLRVLGDKFIGRNMYFQPIISQVGGGVAGPIIMSALSRRRHRLRERMKATETTPLKPCQSQIPRS